jgi:hypothetical protein
MTLAVNDPQPRSVRSDFTGGIGLASSKARRLITCHMVTQPRSDPGVHARTIAVTVSPSARLAALPHALPPGGSLVAAPGSWFAAVEPLCMLNEAFQHAHRYGSCSQQRGVLSAAGEFADPQVIGLVTGRERAGGLCSYGSEISGTGGARFVFSVNEGGWQVHDYPVRVDSVADMRQGPAEGGAAALEYLNRSISGQSRCVW